MSWTTDGITYLGSVEHDLGRTIRARTVHTDKVIQLYLAGRLVAARPSVDGGVSFVVPDAGPTDLVLLLAVDEPDAWVNYWPQAFPEAAEHGNRLRIRLPRWLRYGAGDVAKISIGARGQSQADRLICEEALFPGGRRSCGRGMDARGSGGRGWYATDAAGRGRGARGDGERGMDAAILEVVTDTLAPGTYPVKVVVEDPVGNESPAQESSATIDGYARPPSMLAVTAHDAGAQTLTLTWTESPDL